MLGHVSEWIHIQKWGSYLCHLLAAIGTGWAKPRLDRVQLTIAACGAFQSMNASFLLQVLLWCGHGRRAITDILFHSIYSQKSVCNLAVDWLKLSPYGGCCSAKEKKKSTVLKPERTGSVCCSSRLQGGSGPLSFIFKCARSHWGQGHRASFPNTANHCFTLGSCAVTHKEGKNVNADLHQCPMRNTER